MGGLHWLLTFAGLGLVISEALLQETVVPGVIDCQQGGSYLTLTNMYWLNSTSFSQILFVELLNEKTPTQASSFTLCWVSSSNQETCYTDNFIETVVWSQQQKQSFQISAFKHLGNDTYTYTLFVNQSCFIGQTIITAPVLGQLSWSDCMAGGSAGYVVTMYWANAFVGRNATINVQGRTPYCNSYPMYLTKMRWVSSTNAAIETQFLVVSGNNHIPCLGNFPITLDVFFDSNVYEPGQYDFSVSFYSQSGQMTNCWIGSMLLPEELSSNLEN